MPSCCFLSSIYLCCVMNANCRISMNLCVHENVINTTVFCNHFIFEWLILSPYWKWKDFYFTKKQLQQCSMLSRMVRVEIIHVMEECCSNNKCHLNLCYYWVCCCFLQLQKFVDTKIIGTFFSNKLKMVKGGNGCCKNTEIASIWQHKVILNMHQ